MHRIGIPYGSPVCCGSPAVRLWLSYPLAPLPLWISYAGALHHQPVRSLSKDDARRIGADLKRWSRRPISATNARALGLCTILIVLVLVAAHHAPQPAAVVRGLAAVYAVMLATLHFMSLGLLRGLVRAGVAEAQDAMDSLRDPRRISGFDMAMTWLLVGTAARYWWE